jgi:hypothetical protein
LKADIPAGIGKIGIWVVDEIFADAGPDLCMHWSATGSSRSSRVLNLLVCDSDSRLKLG